MLEDFQCGHGWKAVAHPQMPEYPIFKVYETSRTLRHLRYTTFLFISKICTKDFQKRSIPRSLPWITQLHTRIIRNLEVITDPARLWTAWSRNPAPHLAIFTIHYLVLCANSRFTVRANKIVCHFPDFHQPSPITRLDE